MAQLYNSAEGGSNGATASFASTGGASIAPFSDIMIGAGASLVFSTATSAHGSLSYAITGASGTYTVLGWNTFNDTSIAVRMYYNPGPVLPSTALRLIDIRNSTTSMARIGLNSSNVLFMQDYNGGSTKWTAAAGLSTNTWYRVEAAISLSASTATMRAAYYLGDATTPVEAVFSTSAGNTGSANISIVYFGSAQSATWTGTSYFDDLAAVPGTTNLIGNYIPNTAGTVWFGG